MGDLSETFDASSKRDRLPSPTAFFIALKSKFDEETASRVIETFQKIGLTPPHNEEEFLRGETGCLAFLNRYGLVLRVEMADPAWGFNHPDRINDSAWILRPLASVTLGQAVLEICPGCPQERQAENSEFLYNRLRQQDIDFWDYKFSNVGHLPVTTVAFPKGVPIVIDRLAVAKLSESLVPVREALKQRMEQENREILEAENRLYGPLREAFEAAWPDKLAAPEASRMKAFWELCEACVQDGRLVAGWNAPQPKEAQAEKCRYGSNDKTLRAAEAARHYQARLEYEARRLPSGAAAAPQSPRPPA